MLNQANCVKSVATGAAFSLQADAGESFIRFSVLTGKLSGVIVVVLKVCNTSAVLLTPICR